MTCACGCKTPLPDATRRGGRQREYIGLHRQRVSAKRNGNTVAKEILRSLGRETWTDQREVPRQSFGIWKTGLYFVVACGIICGMIGCDGRMPTEPKATVATVDPCTAAPYNCASNNTGCYQIPNQPPGTGYEQVCSYPPGGPK